MSIHGNMRGVLANGLFASIPLIFENLEIENCEVENTNHRTIVFHFSLL